ncbi:ATP-dependent DNA helicase MPH1 [Scheffersomyces coipomensis]|uniref:ATP-dependent DNA helicase MPH1 n=1 Tax=Scheffersomyces coipomensis TaxID=1788519 RepID=UPI00315D160F
MSFSDDSAFDDDDSELEAIVTNGVNVPIISKPPPQSRPKQKSKPQYEEIIQPIPGAINHHAIDYYSLATYIYPTNFEVRDYQFNIVRRAFYDNLLVALPTGLGKTFIASTVMLNFLRWFPDSKIIFMAPTKPLVAQQIKAFCSITGISTNKVAILLDKTRKNRGEIWDSKQVFFTTPQVVENDLSSSLIDPKSISLLVIDEAHRSKGNYAYNNVVKYLERFNRSYRVLALTATPASTVDGVQEIIDNLKISKVEVRTEQSIDIIKHMKRKKIVRRIIQQSDDINECVDFLCIAIAPMLKEANAKGIYDVTNPKYINFFTCMEASRRVMMNTSMASGFKWGNIHLLSIIGVVGQCFKRLNIYGVRSFHSYFIEKYKEFEAKFNNPKNKKSKLATDFYFHPAIKDLLKRSEEILNDDTEFSHPKIQALVDELDLFFGEGKDDSRVIIFTEFRESALEIVQSIEKIGKNLKPHIFIGQSKEKDKVDDDSEIGTNKNKKGKKKVDNRSSERTSSENAQITGMNQKLQKEIIKKFKAGTFNILVATSIGEEGLDIGEVDLIICYDSTSSPIKNVQRMGRTGRKRDGKVVLLFSGNEETKFNKAMDGYEYIQQHIQKGELIRLQPQNRIIPKEYEPKVEKKFIEIPDENKELKVEDDADEIIRIATEYMIGSSKKKKTTKKNGKAEKKQKQFFMPENVETGFKSANTMVRRIDDNDDDDEASDHESSRPRDFLDTIVDFDSDDDLPIGKRNESISNSKKTDTSVGGTTNDNSSTFYELSDHSSEDDDSIPLASTKLNKKLPHRSSSSSPPPPIERGIIPMPQIKRSYAPEPSIIRNNISSPSPAVERGIIPTPQMKRSYIQEPIITPNTSTTSKKKTLGVKRPRIQNDILGQLQRQSNKIIKTSSPEVTIVIDDDEDDKEDEDLPLSSIGNSGHLDANSTLIEEKQNSNHHSINLDDEEEDEFDNDEFDDSLDDELLRLPTKTSIELREPTLEPDIIMDKDFPLDFKPNDGFLNEDDKLELYTYYYFNLDGDDQQKSFDPNLGVNSRGNIGHSKKSNQLITMIKIANEVKSADADAKIEEYKRRSKKRNPDVSDIRDMVIIEERE